MPLSVGHVVRHAGASLRADRLLRRARRRQLLVVCYHGLRADEASARHWLLLPTSAFEEQIAFVARHYDCLPVDEALERLRAGRLTRPTACVTFDDGYTNNLTLGLPVLRVRGPYFVILTFGVAELVKYLIMAYEAASGTASRILFGTPDLDVVYLAMGLLAALSAGSRPITRSGEPSPSWSA